MEVSGGGAGAAIVAADGDDVCAGFGDSGGDDADARAGNQLHAMRARGFTARKSWIKLREVFNAVNIVMRRRRNQRSAGVACRMRAMYSLTLRAGNWPPSPGLEPWAILISSSSAWTR